MGKLVNYLINYPRKHLFQFYIFGFTYRREDKKILRNSVPQQFIKPNQANPIKYIRRDRKKKTTKVASITVAQTANGNLSTSH